MSRLLDLRNGVVSTVQALTGAGERFLGVTATAHGGEFDDLAELERYAKQTPALVVTILRVKTEVEGGQTVADCTLGAFVIAKEKPGLTRHDGALILADNFLDFLTSFRAQHWGVEATGGIRGAIARNLYHKDFDTRNIALWGIFWDQTVELTEPTGYEVVYPNLDTVHVDYDLYPRDNAAVLNAVIDAQDDIGVAISPDTIVMVSGVSVTVSGAEVTI